MESLLGNHDIVFGLGDSKIFHTYSGCKRYFDKKSYEFDDMGTLLSVYK